MVLAANTANVTSTTTITRTRMIFRRHFKEKSLTSCGRLGTGPNGPSADNDSRQIHWFVQCRMSIPYPNTVDQVGTCYLSTVGGRGLLRQFAIKKKKRLACWNALWFTFYLHVRLPLIIPLPTHSSHINLTHVGLSSIFLRHLFLRLQH